MTLLTTRSTESDELFFVYYNINNGKISQILRKKDPSSTDELLESTSTSAVKEIMAGNRISSYRVTASNHGMEILHLHDSIESINNSSDFSQLPLDAVSPNVTVDISIHTRVIKIKFAKSIVSLYNTMFSAGASLKESFKFVMTNDSGPSTHQIEVVFTLSDIISNDPIIHEIGDVEFPTANVTHITVYGQKAFGGILIRFMEHDVAMRDPSRQSNLIPIFPDFFMDCHYSIQATPKGLTMIRNTRCTNLIKFSIKSMDFVYSGVDPDAFHSIYTADLTRDILLPLPNAGEQVYHSQNGMMIGEII
jgi:hypothetical protein